MTRAAPPLLVAIDAGNTRIKWGVHDGQQWLQQGALPTVDAASLAEVAAAWPADATLVACCVAGAAVEQAINAARAVVAGAPAVRWLRASANACGVHNGYDQPTRLGADRWAALIGARALTPSACLVVCAGTATTVDWLDADGSFRGGLILPGTDLMLRALALNTAQLPLAAGHYRATPRNTMDAIVSGCLHAQLGAIERMFRPLADESGALCLLTGGGAAHLTEHLSIPRQLADNLILDGLRRYAR